MTVLDNGTRNEYTATASQTVFQYTFEITVSGDVKVEQNGTIITTYTVSNIGNDDGGNITLNSGATAGDLITIYRDMPFERLTNFQNQGDFLASDINGDQDRIWLALQQNETNISLIDNDIIPTVTLTNFLLTTTSGLTTSSIVKFDGYLTPGDGGLSKPVWKHTGNTGLTASQSPLDTGDILITDASGNEYQLVNDGVVNVLDLGYDRTGSTDNRPLHIQIDVSTKFAALSFPEGTYRMASAFASAKTQLINMAVFAMDTGTWDPRQFIDLTGTGYNSGKTIYSSDYTATPAVYDLFEPARQINIKTVNLAGRQQVSGAGSRSQMTQVYLNTRHFGGEGDCYNMFFAASIDQHSNIGSATGWGDQNSCGFMNGQINANTPKVNLYGAGDMVLNDSGFDDVSMLNVIFLDHTGGDTGDYDIPRVGQLISSIGTSAVDALISLRGATFSTLDLTGANPTSDASIAIKSGDGIFWDAINGTGSGVFATQDVGTTKTQSDGTTLTDTVDGNPILQRAKSTVIINSDIDSATLLTIRGVSTTAGVTFGVIGVNTYISAFSSGSDSTNLFFRTASSGTENIRLKIAPSGTCEPGADDTQSFGTIGTRWGDVFSTEFHAGDGTTVWTSGSGTPEGNLTAVIGSMYTRTDGGAGTTLYIKESGTGNTGWAAK